MPEKKNTIGRFEIIDKIGEGPIGSVYKALDPVIRRTVAIKVIKLYALEETTTFAEVFEKIYRVVRTSTALNHPNICIIYDLSEEKKIPYITMEFVEGNDLDSLLLKKHQFKKMELLNVLQQICDALDFAHRKNVIHQDLKSTNILVTSDLHVKITDFGIAGLDEIAAAQTKKLLGIPYYISPEQALGERVSTSSDLFSLGVVIYHLLSGQLPFPGSNAANAIMMIARDNPAVPVDLDKSGISREDWDAFFEIALAKSASRRFRSAKEMYEAVSAILPPSDYAYFPFSFAGAMNESTGKFEKTFLAESAGPTLMIDPSQIMKEAADHPEPPNPSAVTLPSIEAPPLFEESPGEVRTLLFEESPVSAPTQMMTMPPVKPEEIEDQPSAPTVISSPPPLPASESQTVLEEAPPIREEPPVEGATKLIEMPQEDFASNEFDDEFAATIRPGEVFASEIPAAETIVSDTAPAISPDQQPEAPTILQPGPTVIQSSIDEPFFVPESIPESAYSVQDNQDTESAPTMIQKQPPSAATVIEPFPPVSPPPVVQSISAKEASKNESSSEHSPTVIEPAPASAPTVIHKLPPASAPTVMQTMPPASAPTVMQTMPPASAPTVINQMPASQNFKSNEDSNGGATAPTVIQRVPTIDPKITQQPIPRQETPAPAHAAASHVAASPIPVAKSAGPPNMRRYMIGALITALVIIGIAAAILLRKPEPTPIVQPAPQPETRPATPAAPPPVAEPQVVTGSIMVTSDPPGANVFLQGEQKGVTPIEIPELQFGTYTVKVQLKGYEDLQQDVEVSSANPYMTVPLTLNKPAAQMGTLVVESQPDGAFIVIGNRVLGTTPKTIPKTRVGTHSITLKKDGYQDFTGTVKVVRDKSVTFSGQLAEIPKPVVQVEPPKPKEPDVRPGQLVGLTADVIPPKAVKKVYAKYPDSARSKRLEGTVRITILVDETGHVIDMKILKSAHPLLDEAVMKAYKDWVFEPATKQGVPVKVWITGTMSFQSSR